MEERRIYNVNCKETVSSKEVSSKENTVDKIHNEEADKEESPDDWIIVSNCSFVKHTSQNNEWISLNFFSL